MAEISSAAARARRSFGQFKSRTLVTDALRFALVGTVAAAAGGRVRQVAEDLGELPLRELGGPRLRAAGGRGRGGRGRGRGRGNGARAPPPPAGAAHRRSL